jgi:hypothetical protein
MGDIHGVHLDPPPDFTVDEVMVTLRGPAMDHLKEPRLLQKQHPVRPNLIIHRRAVGEGALLDLLCGEICAELVNSIDGMQNLASEPFVFADGCAGFLVTFDFPVRQATVRQFQTMRLDAAILTTLTMTVEATSFNDQAKAAVFKALASVHAPHLSNPAIPTL